MRLPLLLQCPAEKNLGAEKVSVFFLFRHLEQQHGFDSIPKLSRQPVTLSIIRNNPKQHGQNCIADLCKNKKGGPSAAF